MLLFTVKSLKLRIFFDLVVVIISKENVHVHLNSKHFEGFTCFFKEKTLSFLLCKKDQTRRERQIQKTKQNVRVHFFFVFLVKQRTGGGGVLVSFCFWPFFSEKGQKQQKGKTKSSEQGVR